MANDPTNESKPPFKDGGQPPLHADGSGAGVKVVAPASAPKHLEVIRKMFVVRKEFWSTPEALGKFDAVVADLRKRIVQHQQMQQFDSILYQWCQVNGQTRWCACVTEIVGGVQQIVCHPVD